MRPLVKSYFSGAGGLDLGLIEGGCDILQALEYDRTCVETLKANFNHKVLLDDIRNVTVLDQDKSDVIAVTFPCTKYSAIADITGTRTGDDLFLHAFRHVALEMPDAFVVENVPGMRKFKVVMECFTKIPNYYVNVFCPLDASNWLPQKRERLIVIGTKKPFSISAPAPSVYRTRLKDIIERNPDVEIPEAVINRLKGKYRDKPIITDPEDVHAMAPTCVAHYHKDRSTRLVKDRAHRLGVRPYSVREYARLQGFPDSFKFSGTENQMMMQIGNAVAVPVGRWIGQQLVKYFN
jgi:DNA (cytosine-5)-methyltransferase 1